MQEGSSDAEEMVVHLRETVSLKPSLETLVYAFTKCITGHDCTVACATGHDCTVAI